MGNRHTNRLMCLNQRDEFLQLRLLTDLTNFVMTHLTRELNLTVDWKCFDVDGIASTSATNKSFAL